MLYGVGLFAVHVSTQSQNPEELPDGTEVPDGIFVPRGSHPSLTVVEELPLLNLTVLSNQVTPTTELVQV
jgi:hypothetical protein